MPHAKRHVYVSIVPFSKDVNVDPVNYSQTGSLGSLDAANAAAAASRQHLL